MPNNSQQDGHKRVRNVPIRLEGDGTESCRYVNNHHYTHRQEPMDYEASYNSHGNQQQSAYEQPLNQSNQRAPTHTSSIDISYRAPQSQQKPPPQPKGPNTKYNDPCNQTNHSSRVDPQSETSSFDKENSASYADRNKSPPHGDSAIEKKPVESDTQEEQPKLPDPIIPLPPPPEVKPTSKGSATESADEQEQHEEGPQCSGPQSIINSTKFEVNRLLQEIANCNETSLKSKEYLRLDELLTLCILKLDDIQSKEWRQQRREVINLINKCTELLERKINLNRDIQQLSTNCA